MPITKSAIKRMKQTEVLRKHNRDIKIDYKNKIKAVNKDLKVGSKNVATLASDAFSALDKAAKKNIIHKRTAARRKSRLITTINKSMSNPVELRSAKIKAEKPKNTAKPKPKKISVAKKTKKKTP